MDFKENTSSIFDNYKKAGRVISSCTNLIQLRGAKEYIKNLKRFNSTITCANEIQSDYLKTSQLELETTLNLKIESLQ
jgi:hypothetical protein